MKMFKKVFAVVLCVAMLASCTAMSTTVFADEAKTVVEGIRWFPCEEGRQNDDIWEVECLADGCGCQRFDDDPAETGNSNYLDTVYGEDGSLTITRNGNDGKGDLYWPRIRTLMLENYPELDLTVANTLYFDFTAHEGTCWNVLISINGMGIKLSQVIAEACGKTDVANSDGDGTAGTYKGSINIQDAITKIAAESGTESSVNAIALQNMNKTYVPQLNIFCVGPVGASLTINEMFISTADDTTGAKCDYLDMGLVYGDEIYELDAEGGDTEGDTSDDTEGDTSDDTEGDTSADDEGTTTTTKAKDKDTDKDDEPAGNTGLIVGIIIAVVVVAAVVVVVVVMKKKKG